MIRNHAERPMPLLPAEKALVFSPAPGACYSHHPSICRFKNVYYVIWSNGFVGEDEPGQRVMIASSPDGLAWSSPRILVTPDEITGPDGILTAAGFHIHGDTLIAYFGHYAQVTGVPSAKRCYRDTFLGYLTSQDGVHWSAPCRTEVPLVPNHGPQATSTGRLIISGNVMFPYSDDPSGIGPYMLAGVYGNALAGEGLRDDPEVIHTITQNRKWLCNLLCEGSFYETDKGVLHMLFRSNSRILWHSESKDDGVTWSEPQPTAFSNDNSKFHCGRLPDGRYYVVSNAITGGPQTRHKLTLSLSRDGEDFDQEFVLRDEPYQPQFPEGRWKGGVYGYPHSLIHENMLYIVYSKCKEAVEVTRLNLDALKKI